MSRILKETLNQIDSLPKEVVDITDILKKVSSVNGQLEKHKDSKWVVRWIKLNIQTQNLHYFLTEKDLKKSKTRGVYPLAGATINKSYDKDIKKFYIEITYNQDTTIVFRWGDFYESQAWFLLIDELAKLQNTNERTGEGLEGEFEVKQNQKWKKKLVQLNFSTRKLRLMKSNRESMSPDTDFDLSGGIVEQLKSYGKHYDLHIVNRYKDELKLRTTDEKNRHDWYFAFRDVFYNNVITTHVSDDLNIKEGYILIREAKDSTSQKPIIIIEGLQHFHSSVKKNFDKALKPQFVMHEGVLSKVLNVSLERMQEVMRKTGFCVFEQKSDSSIEYVRIVREISAKGFATDLDINVVTDALKYQK